jgi:uncharacterized membrane protein
MTSVRARVPVAGGARRAHLREWRRESLWLWPAVAALAAWAGGALASRHLQSFTLHQGLFPTDLDDSRTLLATIAAALLTFTGVVFSITLVALQMASTQYSPRVLRTFVRKPITKLALATFIATFVYSLTVLASVGTAASSHRVSQGAVGLAFLLVIASVLVFVVFVHSTVRSMRVSYVIQAVFSETLRTVEAVFAPASSYREAAEPAFVAAPALIAYERADAVLDGIDGHNLVELARQHGCVLRLRVPVGSLPPPVAAVMGTFDRSAVRTLYQDPGYGVRQLVDIAIRALSPAVNDPTTAVQVLDRLHGVMRAVAVRPDPSGMFVDGAGSVRLVAPVPGWDRFVQLAFTEIGLYGSGSPQVTRKLTAIYDDLSACVTAERVGAIQRQREWLRDGVARTPGGLGGDQVLSPDLLGLG